MFSNPLGLMALIAVPAIVALHLYRQRHRPVEVSALFLWETARRDPSAGPTRDRLERTLSLLLECLAAALLAGALAGPRGCDEGGRHLVIVLDSTASMLATAGTRSAADEAVARIQAELDQLRGRDRVTILRQDGSVLVGPQALSDEASDALDAWRPSGAGGDVRDALDLATALAGGAGVWAISDAPQPEDQPWPEHVRRSALGTAAENVGFIDAARSVDPPGILATVASFSATPWSGLVALRSGEQALGETPITLAPGQTQSLRFPLPVNAGELDLRLLNAGGDPWIDALEADNLVMMAPPVDRTVLLGSTLPPAMNRALGLSGGADDLTGVARWAAAVPQSRAEIPSKANLILSLSPADAPGAWVVLLTGPAAPDQDHPEAMISGPLLRTQHPLLNGVSGVGLLWTPARRLALAEQDNPVLMAGDRPLIVQHPGDNPRFTLDLDPWRSTVSRSADWPVLLLNLAELRRAALPGLQASNLRAGEVLRWTGDGEFALTITGERSTRLTGRDVIEANPDGLGRFTVARDGEEEKKIAVNLLNAGESDLRDRGAEERTTDGPLAQASVGGGGAEVLLVLLALALMVADHALLAVRRA